MLKYIGIILALMPFIVLAQRIFMRSIKRSQAAAEFKKQLASGTVNERWNEP
jgi:uncharacterized membrane protein YbaN (DUF454 family)